MQGPPPSKRAVNCGRMLTPQANQTDCIDFLTQYPAYSYTITPAFHPGFNRGPEPNLPDRPISRSCRVLNNANWSSYVVAAISEHIDVDSECYEFRIHSEKLLEQELSYVLHVNCNSVMVKIRSENSINLARMISAWLDKFPHMTVFVHVPLQNPEVEFYANRSDVCVTTEHSTTWEWWNKFRSYADHNSRLGVMLEVGPDLPTESDRSRWTAEPVRAIMLKTSTFLTNVKGYPVLSKAHQEFTKPFAEIGSNVIIAGRNRHSDIQTYAQYMKFLWNVGVTAEDLEFSSYFDYLQCPLQPLKDNLEAMTYEVFERDPVKYRVYREAVESALLDRVSDEQLTETVTVIVVMGAGRGPLVQMSLQAARNVNRKVRVYAVEKNPNAVITLQCRRDEEWRDQVTIVAGDMRDITLPEKADIMVSELLGSFGDNELSPECLDGAQKFLKDDGISIPQEYTSYVCPVMSHKLYAEARAQKVDRGHPDGDSLETMYVVMLKNKQYLGIPQPLFTFRHPNRDDPIDNKRYAKLSFPIARNSTLHGFAGFFHTTLYSSHTLSIVPETFSSGMISWYPIFIPIQRPVALTGGCEIDCHFWRCVGDQHVWYEWTISSPEALPVHNLAGRASKIGLF